MAGEQAKIITAPPEIIFATGNVGPPSPLYIGRDDRLFVRLSTIGVLPNTLVNYRLLLPGGEVIANTINVPDSGSANGTLQVFDAAEGFLLDLCVTQVGAAPTRGTKFVQVGIMRGGTGAANVAHLLIADYQFDTWPLIWPGGVIRLPVGEEGSFANIAFLASAAGANFVEVSPNATIWRIKSIFFQFVTDATVATRTVRLVFDDGVNTFHRTAAAIDQPAGLTLTYCASATGFVGSASAGDIQIPIPDTMILRPGFRFRSLINNIQVTDQVSLGRYYVERWLSNA